MVNKLRYLNAMRPSSHDGLSLIELLLAMALGLIVTLASISLLISSKSGYQTLDEMSRVEESGRYALETIARAIRQAGFVNWGGEENPFVVEKAMSPNITGYDNSRLSASTPELTSPITPGVLGSDVLAVRFFGAGTADKADGTIIDCAGFPVAHPPSREAARHDSNGQGRGWSIFYVDTSADGEPELRCKYQYQRAWRSAPLVRGVESFQVLYGVDKNSNGFADHFLTANQIRLMDDQHKGSSQDAHAHSWWKNVVAVRIAVLVRGTQNIVSAKTEHTYHLFGEAYTKTAGHDDHVAFNSDAFAAETRQRPRKVFETTIVLRNKTLPRVD
jgi:type IV pilus assembly protein PilW